MPIDRRGRLLAVAKTSDSENASARKELIEDEVIYWGIRGYTRLLKKLGDASELSGRITERANQLPRIIAYRPLNWLIGHIFHRIGRRSEL